MIICKKQVLEAGYAYLVSNNSRYTNINVELLIIFHKRICHCVNDFTRLVFEQMRLGRMSEEEAEVCIHIMRIRYFEMLMPVIGIIQDMTSVEESAELFNSFQWMEQIDRMMDFLSKNDKCIQMSEKMNLYLSMEVPENKKIDQYEKNIS